MGRALGEEGRTRIGKIVKLHPEIKSRLLFHFEGGEHRKLSYRPASSPLKNDMFSQPRGAVRLALHLGISRSGKQQARWGEAQTQLHRGEGAGSKPEEGLQGRELLIMQTLRRIPGPGLSMGRGWGFVGGKAGRWSWAQVTEGLEGRPENLDFTRKARGARPEGSQGGKLP